MTPAKVDHPVPVSVPMLDLVAQHKPIATQIGLAIEEVLASGRFVLGPEVERFEQEVAAYCRCAHGVGVSSGSDALLVALMALGVGCEHEVITTPFTFFATGGAIVRLGARPLFCDIDPATYNLSPESLAQLIDRQCHMKDGRLINRTTGRWVKVLLPVHLYGQLADMNPLMALAQEHGLKVVEDAAQALGAAYGDGRRAGSFGDVGCFSFFPTKNLGGLGDGGMCTTNDAQLAKRLRILRNHGSDPKYHHALVGGNFRLDALQAAVLSVKLGYLDDWTSQRQANAAYYRRALDQPGLRASVTLPHVQPGYRHIFNQFVLRVQRRDALREALATACIKSEVYYPIPLHLQACFAFLGYQRGDLPQSEQAAEQSIAIPIHPELREAQRRHVVETIRLFYA